MIKSILKTLLFIFLFVGATSKITYAALQGEGTSTYPYNIYTIDDLKEINNKTGYFKLANDIDLNSEEMKPLVLGAGSYFDGDNYTIKNLKILSSGTVGLFSTLSNVTIKNLTIENADVLNTSTTGIIQTGALAGKISGCNIDNVVLKGNTKVVSTGYSGGLFGLVDNNSIVKNVSVIGNTQVISNAHYSGGIVGYLYKSTIENSKISANLNIGSINYVGGLASFIADSQVLNCKVNSNIIVTNGVHIGGLAGYVDGNTTKITLSQVQGLLNCESSNLNTYIGGFIGYLTNATVDKASSNIKIMPNNNAVHIGAFISYMYSGIVSNSYAVGEIQTTKPTGFIGILYTTKPKVINCYLASTVKESAKTDMVATYGALASASQISSSYFDKNISSIPADNNFSKSTLEMKDKSNYIGWNFDYIWKIEPGKYPTLLEMLPIEDEKNIDENIKLSILLEKNETVQLIMTRALKDNVNYEWISEDDSVVTVYNNGKVLAVGDGITNIVVKNKTTNKVESISIRVSSTLISSEERLSIYLSVGSKIKLTVSDPNKQVIYTSMDTNIASVNNDGVVTTIGKGLAIIKAEYDDNIELIYIKVSGI